MMHKKPKTKKWYLYQTDIGLLGPYNAGLNRSVVLLNTIILKFTTHRPIARISTIRVPCRSYEQNQIKCRRFLISSHWKSVL